MCDKIASPLSPCSINESRKLKLASLDELSSYMSKHPFTLLDCVFSDPLGQWHHFTYAHPQCDIETLTRGFAFDGSSVPLFSEVYKSDMFMRPDVTTAKCWLDPFTKHPTLHVLCNIVYPSGEPYERCPRQLAARASRMIRQLGIADEAYFGPEPEFFVFDNVNYSVAPREASFVVDGNEAPWRSGGGGSAITNNLAHRCNHKNYYAPINPIDQQVDLRGDMLMTLQSVGLEIEKHHHEAAALQGELGIVYDKLVDTADNVLTYKYIVKNIARMHGKTATFMPKPLVADNGSGCHMHQSLWKNGTNLFFDDKNVNYAKLSQMALYYIGGILHHAPAICAFSNPTTNSYKRLVPGFEAPCYLVFSSGNRSAAIRIPLTDDNNPAEKRIECRFPDPSCNPYLTFAAMVMAGCDGILNKIEPPAPIDVSAYSLAGNIEVRALPGSLSEALEALEKDKDFLMRNDVFGHDFIESYITRKKRESRLVETTPHPREFELYYHV